MNNIIKRTWKQNGMVQIEDLRGQTFQNESGGHTFVIRGEDEDGNQIALSGSPAGVFLRPDNTDQALTCSISNGMVYATLPAACYDVPGRAGITIYLTSGGQKTALYAAMVSVGRTSTGTVAPGTTADVVDLINRINEVVATIPLDYSALSNEVVDIKSKISDSQGNVIPSEELKRAFKGTDIYTWQENSFVNVNGTITPNYPGYSSSDYIEIPEGTTSLVVSAAFNHSGLCGIGFYSGKKTFISCIYNVGADNVERTVAVPDNTKYVRLSAVAGKEQNAYIKHGINMLVSIAEKKCNDKSDGIVNELNIKVSNTDAKEYLLYGSLNSHWQLRKLNSRNFVPYELPFDLPIGIATDGNRYIHNFDITKYKNPENAVYYVAPNGSADNDGSREYPKRLQDFLVHGALIDSDNVTAILMDGIYRDLVGGRQKAYRNINLIAEHPGKAIIANAADVLTYTQDSTYTNCYTATRSNVLKIVQISADENLLLNPASSASDCDNTPGSWYKDSSNKLYVHLFFDEIPTFNNTVVLLKYNLPTFEVPNTYQNTKLYLEGITFMGGNPCTLKVTNTSTYTDARIYAKDCKFIGAWSDDLSYDAVSVLGATAYFVNCEAAYSSKDGFNYHKANGVVCKFIEISCKGCNNGIDGFAESIEACWQNGSTAHEGSYGIRIDGIYYNNYGANVADVHEGTTTVNLNCKAFDSAYHGNNISANCDFCAQQAGTTMYIAGCVGFGSMKSCRGVSGTTIYLHGNDFEVPAQSDGTIIEN